MTLTLTSVTSTSKGQLLISQGAHNSVYGTKLNTSRSAAKGAYWSATGNDGMSDMFNSDIVDKTATLFKEAVLALDTSLAVTLMREDVQLFSPVPRAPFAGRNVVGAVFDFLATIPDFNSSR
jgi:hypothetical protein